MNTTVSSLNLHRFRNKSVLPPRNEQRFCCLGDEYLNLQRFSLGGLRLHFRCLGDLHGLLQPCLVCSPHADISLSATV